MKIRLLMNQEEQVEVTKELESKGIEINNINYDFTLTSSHTMDKFMGYRGKEIFLLRPSDVLYFESFGNEIICHTHDQEYSVKYKLYEIVYLFYDHPYMRISNSYIVNLKHIKSIKPTLNSKFILTLSNNDTVEVTRSYYRLFKEYIEGGNLR